MSKLRNVPEIRVMVMRDPTEKISNTYPAYEVPILVHLHNGHVDVVGPEYDQEGEPLMRDIDEGAEIARLVARHGEEEFTRVYGPAVPGCLERVIDGVLEMADDDSEVLTESEEYEQKQRAAARQRRLSQMAARRKGVIRPRRGEAPVDQEDDGDQDDLDLNDLPAGQEDTEVDEFAALDAAEEEYLEAEGEESEVDGEEEAPEVTETAEQEAARKRSEAAKKAAATRAAKKAEAQG